MPVVVQIVGGVVVSTWQLAPDGGGGGGGDGGRNVDRTGRSAHLMTRGDDEVHAQSLPQQQHRRHNNTTATTTTRPPQQQRSPGRRRACAARTDTRRGAPPRRPVVVALLLWRCYYGVTEFRTRTSRAALTISATGATLPSTFDTWTTETSLVRGESWSRMDLASIAWEALSRANLRLRGRGERRIARVSRLRKREKSNIIDYLSLSLFVCARFASSYYDHHHHHYHRSPELEPLLLREISSL